MSFSSINAVRASGGLGGTTRQSPATFAGPQIQQPVPQHPPLMAPPRPVDMSSAYTVGAGMQNTGRVPQIGQANRTIASRGDMRMATVPDAHGVIAGSTSATPNVIPPQQALQFDPNDPNNAALAGYMAAR